MKLPPRKVQFARIKKRILQAKRALTNKRVIIDFETRCDLDVTDVGAYRYSKHPSCEVIMMSYNFTDDPEQTKLWDITQPPPEHFIRYVKKHKPQLNAFNSYFEYCIWQHVCVRQLGFPELEDHTQFLDVGDKSKAVALPGNLGEAGQVMQLDTTKDKEGKRLIKLFCAPAKYTKSELAANDDLPKFRDHTTNPDDWEMFKSYCIDDTKTELLLDNILPDLTPLQQVIAWMIDGINIRGVYVDLEVAKACDKLSIDLKAKYNAEAAELSGGAFEKCTQRDKVKIWLKEQGVTMPNMQADTVDKFLRKPTLKPHVRRMLELYRIAAPTASSKFANMMKYVEPTTGRIHELLSYHVATTGRLGARGIQIQNLPRPTLPKGTDYVALLEWIKTAAIDEVIAKAKVMKVTPTAILSSLIRSTIMADIGNILIASDYSSIEARGLLWLAQDEAGLKVFRKGLDIYKFMAMDMYNVKYDDVTPDQRFTGKTAILGCGYQCGGKSLATQAENLSGGEVVWTTKEGQKVVDAYRKKFKKVVKLWKDVEASAIKAVNSQGKVVALRNMTFHTEFVGKLKFLFITLPSGRRLAYPNVRTESKQMEWGEKKGVVYDGYDSYTRKWGKIHSYGGKFVENIVQALSGDLMLFGMLNLDCNGYPPIMSVHDEVVAEVEDGTQNQEEFDHLLCAKLPWADGLPLAAEGWTGYNYRK